MALVFLSYSRRNESVATALIKDLEALGYDVWLDRELNGGQRWWDTILEQIRNCDVFVLGLTLDSLASAACKSELSYAHALGKPILPVLLADVSLHLLPRHLAELQLVDCREFSREAVFRLARSLRGFPASTHLPAQLPTPPVVPGLDLGTLAERGDAPTLDLDRQRAELPPARFTLRAPSVLAALLLLTLVAVVAVLAGPDWPPWSFKSAPLAAASVPGTPPTPVPDKLAATPEATIVGSVVEPMLQAAHASQAVADAAVQTSKPEHKGPRFRVSKDGVTVFDTKTRLTWQRELPRTYAGCNGGAEPGAACVWYDAIMYCERLTLAGGGWHLPGGRALRSIVKTPAVTGAAPAIDLDAFPNTPPATFWSSSVDSTVASCVDFATGESRGDMTSLAFLVRCVR